MFEFLVILLLTVINAFFALAEIAVVTSRKSKLKNRARKGSRVARTVLALKADTEGFLSSVQLGITLIGTIAGAYGGIAFAGDFEPFLATIPILAPYAYGIALFIVVAIITYLSLVIGELLPKSIALANPEGVAAFVAPIMLLFMRVTHPLVWVLSFSTRGVLKLLRIKTTQENPITDEELKILIDEAESLGSFSAPEADMIRNMLRFTDRTTEQIMTPRHKMEWIDVAQTPDEVAAYISETGKSVYPVCRGSLDEIAGILFTKTFYRAYNENRTVNILNLTSEPLYVYNNLTSLRLLSLFRGQKQYFAIVLDEHGSVEGLLTLHDLAENIFGRLPDVFTESHSPDVLRREDGSLLIDGNYRIDELDDLLGTNISAEDEAFVTIGGFVMAQLNKVPTEGDTFIHSGYRFEVVDMDGKKVDKVLTSKEAGPHP